MNFFNNKRYRYTESITKQINELYKDLLTVKLNAVDVQRILDNFNISKHSIKGEKFPLYSATGVEMLMKGERRDLFKDELKKCSALKQNKPTVKQNKPTVKQNKPNISLYDNEPLSLSYNNDENDMEKYSEYLINHVYQNESKPKRITIKENTFKRLFEDVFMTNANQKKKTVQLKYNKNGGKYNKGNESSFDMIKTDKMDNDNNDTYEIPLKGGIMSYNITSITGTEVMHYFKRIFNKQKTYAKLMKYGNEEYELEMEDSEFRAFMEQFTQKVNKVVEKQISVFQQEGVDIDGVYIYPVPSSSNFNVEMSKRMQFRQLGGFTPKLINQSILQKDLSNLQKDDDFINKNIDYYTDRYSNSTPKDVTHLMHVDREFNRFEAISKAQKNIETANIFAKQLIQKYYTRKEQNTDKFYAKLNDLYLNYINAVNNIVNLSKYFDSVSQKYSNVQLSKMAKAIKYSKGPSIEERTNEIYDMLRSKGYLKDMPRNKITQVCYWEPVNFQIKTLTNDVRMGLKNYFQKTNNEELLNKELDGIKQKAVIIFDDNISGGATLGDICYQLKQLGVEYIIPITFGKMKGAWNSRTINVNQPKNWNF